MNPVYVLALRALAGGELDFLIEANKKNSFNSSLFLSCRQHFLI